MPLAAAISAKASAEGYEGWVMPGLGWRATDLDSAYAAVIKICSPHCQGQSASHPLGKRQWLLQ